MSENKRDFKGVWISKEIWLTDKLSPIEKMFLIEIDSLDNEKGCFASNSHFSKLFHRAKNTCSEIIKSLENKGFIGVQIKRDGKIITKRIIKVRGIRKTDYPYSENRDTPIRKIDYPYSENREENNTITNNTKIERETRPLDFLKTNFPSRFDTDFLMKYKSEIKDFKKFCEDFNDKVDMEGKEYSDKLFYRLSSYARNWIEINKKYQAKEDQKETKPVYLRKII